MKLIDTQPFKYQLLESAQSHGRTRVRGTFQRADEKNANGRIYSRKLWEKLLSDNAVKETLDRRRMIGEVDHPLDSELKLEKAAILVTGLSLSESGEVVGELEILPTLYGQHVSTLFEAGVELGISSRGEGTTYTKEGLEYINENDYNLITFDIVASPSTRGAYPKVIRESAGERPSEAKEINMAINEKFAELRKDARSLVEVDLSKTTAAQRADIRVAADKIMESMDRLAIEDPGLRSLSESTNQELREAMKALNSKGAPPVLESQLEAAEKVVSEIVEQVAARDRKSVRTISKMVSEKVNKLSEALSNSKSRNRALVNENARLRRTLATAEQVGEEIVTQYVELSKSLGEKKVDRKFRTEAKGPSTRRSLTEDRRPARSTSDVIKERLTLQPKSVRRLRESEVPDDGTRQQVKILENFKRNSSFKL